MSVEPHGFLQLVLVYKCMQQGPEGMVVQLEVPV